VFNLRHSLVGLGVAVVASAGAAHAEPAKPAATVAPAATVSGEIPWFERFTASTMDDAAKSNTSGATNQTITGMLTSHWGFSVNVRDADRSKTAPRGEAAIGAFFDFTPRIRLGGEVRVADPVVGGAPGSVGAAPREQSAGVKLESAFRF
jgi:hypothetical protein